MEKGSVGCIVRFCIFSWYAPQILNYAHTVLQLICGIFNDKPKSFAMSQTNANKNLHAAKNAKKDEFYTQNANIFI